MVSVRVHPEGYSQSLWIAYVRSTLVSCVEVIKKAETEPVDKKGPDSKT